MNVYVSLLRAINVGGANIISMDTLCGIYYGLGFTCVRTYLQSGNVVFESTEDDRSQLVSHIEAQIEKMLGFHVEVFIRQARDLQELIANNPFLREPQIDTRRLHVAFLYRAPAEAAWSKLVIPQDIPEKLARRNLELYLYYPNGTARAKLSGSYLEKSLGVPMTIRNWNTVNALYKISSEM